VRNAFDAASIHYEGKWEGVGPWNREFLGPVKWHRADRRVAFGAQKLAGSIPTCASNVRLRLCCFFRYALRHMYIYA